MAQLFKKNIIRTKLEDFEIPDFEGINFHQNNRML
jgi:hypothetical protein